MNMRKFILMQLLCLGCLTGIWGQSAQTSAAMSASATRTDSLYTFRFVQGKDAFYVPWRENGTQLGQLTDLLQSHREAVVNGSIPVVVNGYCTGQASRQENLHMAAVRSNRVKSELIVRTDITEDCFKTANHAAEYNGLRNVVTVTLRIPVAEGDLRTERDFSSVNDTDSADSGNKRKPETSVQPAAPAQSEKRTQTEASTQPKVSVSSAPSADEKSLAPFSFRLNLLRWATLTPDLGIEYRPCTRLGILLNATWTSWSWQHKSRRYALWNLSPQIRYYLGTEHRGYLGLLYQTGDFNYKLSDTGRQGNYHGIGLTGGYLWMLTPHWGIDFHLAAGYTHAEYNKYTLTDGIRVHHPDGHTKNYWGINSAGLTLVWKIGGNK